MAHKIGREVVVRDHAISFIDQEISPSPLRYLAHHFRDGEKFGCVVNPFCPQTAHLFDAQGRWIGQVQQLGVVSRLDTEGLHEAMGRARRVEAELLEPIARRGAVLTKQRLDDARHNAGVLAGESEGSESRAATLADTDDFLTALSGGE
jgi:hypothetical protein